PHWWGRGPGWADATPAWGGDSEDDRIGSDPINGTRAVGRDSLSGAGGREYHGRGGGGAGSSPGGALEAGFHRGFPAGTLALTLAFAVGTPLAR
ncbi:MAG: hypothetical protein ACYC61_22310, partial [Isosphaeraceae bacterium]